MCLQREAALLPAASAVVHIYLEKGLLQETPRETVESSGRRNQEQGGPLPLNHISRSLDQQQSAAEQLQDRGRGGLNRLCCWMGRVGSGQQNLHV